MTRAEHRDCMRVLLNLLAGKGRRRTWGPYDGVKNSLRTAVLLKYRDWIRWYPMRLTQRGRDALARHLLRDFTP